MFIFFCPFNQNQPYLLQFYSFIIERMQQNSQESERLKGASRINKHQDAQQIYKCQCGRDYLTFSALYLHAKLKHGNRLTTRRTQSNHRIERIGNKTIVTYLLKEVQNVSQNQYNYKEKKVQKECVKISQTSKFNAEIKLIHEYIDFLKNTSELQTISDGILYSVMQNFVDYFTALNKLKTKKQDMEQEEGDITYYFNEFSTYYMPIAKKNSQNPYFQIHQTVNSLNIFYKWLKQSRYTQVKLLCNETFTRKTAYKQSQ